MSRSVKIVGVVFNTLLFHVCVWLFHNWNLEIFVGETFLNFGFLVCCCLRGSAINLVGPLCRNLLCHFAFFAGLVTHFWPYKGFYQKSIMLFGIIF